MMNRISELTRKPLLAPRLIKFTQIYRNKVGPRYYAASEYSRLHSLKFVQILTFMCRLLNLVIRFESWFWYVLHCLHFSSHYLESKLADQMNDMMRQGAKDKYKNY